MKLNILGDIWILSDISHYACNRYNSKNRKTKRAVWKGKTKMEWSPKIAQKEGGSPLKRIKNILLFSILT